MTDALTLLKEDHREVEELFRRFEHLAEEGLGEGKPDLVRHLTRELSIHAAVEERIFYPAVRSALADGRTLSEHLRRQHREVEALLADLEASDAGSPGFDGKVRAVIAGVRAHVREEEGEVFPRIQSGLPSRALERMGDAMEKAKKTAPTHPHPAVPATSPADVVTGPAMEAVDRLRDRSRPKKVALIAVIAGALGLIAWRTVRRRAS